MQIVLISSPWNTSILLTKVISGNFLILINPLSVPYNNISWKLLFVYIIGLFIFEQILFSLISQINSPFIVKDLNSLFELLYKVIEANGELDKKI